MISHRGPEQQRSDSSPQLAKRADSDGSGGAASDTSAPDAQSASPRESRAHAMKNCLSVINAVAYLCERELSERGRERMAQLTGASARLLELIDKDGGVP